MTSAPPYSSLIFARALTISRVGGNPRAVTAHLAVTPSSLCPPANEDLAAARPLTAAYVGGLGGKEEVYQCAAEHVNDCRCRVSLTWHDEAVSGGGNESERRCGKTGTGCSGKHIGWRGVHSGQLMKDRLRRIAL